MLWSKWSKARLAVRIVRRLRCRASGHGLEPLVDESARALPETGRRAFPWRPGTEQVAPRASESALTMQPLQPHPGWGGSLSREGASHAGLSLKS